MPKLYFSVYININAFVPVMQMVSLKKIKLKKLKSKNIKNKYVL